MPYNPITNFKDSNGIDLGKKLITKDYLLSVYSSLSNNIPNLTLTPSLLAWGDGARTGTNALIAKSTPVTTFSGGTNWKTVSAVDDNHLAAIKYDGTLWCWGNNTNGQLGNNIALARSTPVTTFTGGSNWSYVSVQDDNTAAIKTDGTLWTWGYNLYNQLGTSGGSRSIPSNLIAGTWKQVSCGLYYMAGIKDDGSLWTWGWNQYATLGTNDTLVRTTPVTTFAGGNDWKSVSAGNSVIAAIKTDGTLWTWGYNLQGTLGINESGANTSRTTPVTTILGGTNWKSISINGGNAYAIKTDGTLWTWGDNLYGQLGCNDNIMRSTPITTIFDGTNWKQVSGGINSVFALKTDGTLWSWGWNNNGQLGCNDTITRSTPVTTFTGENNWKQVAAAAGIKSVDYI